MAEESQQVAGADHLDESAGEQDGPPAVAKVNEKFFVVKSLTVEDLETSVRNGMWATQAHNETALNKAYEASISTNHVRKTSLTLRRRLRMST